MSTFAQTPETRAGEIAGLQEEKAQKLQPYRRNFFEKEPFEIERSGGFAVGRGLTVAPMRGGLVGAEPIARAR